MIFYVENETEVTFPFDVEELVEKVCVAVLDYENCPYEAQINVILTDNAGIKEVNYETRDIDRETDVLSFPNVAFLNPGLFDIPEEDEADYFDPDSGELILGDIMISVDKVYEQAESYGHSPLREFAVLVAHSMFHLSGYDQMTPADARDMENRQETILTGLGITRE